MEIGITIYQYAPYEGHARHCLNIARELSRRGHKVRLYCMKWVGEKPEELHYVQVPVKSKVPEQRNEFFQRWVQAHRQKYPLQLLVGFNKMPGLDVCLVTEGCYKAQVAESRNWVYKMSAAYKFWSDCEDAVFGPASKTQRVTHMTGSCMAYCSGRITLSGAPLAAVAFTRKNKRAMAERPSANLCCGEFSIGLIVSINPQHP